MSTLLAQILAHKAVENEQRGECPFVRERPLHEPLLALRQRPFIAEIKRASPSAGTINPLVDVVAQAQSYQRYGAGMVSVLTDARYFNGDFATLHQVAQSVNLPILCKDFIIDESQIDWAYASGADLVLLLVTALSPSRLQQLYLYAREQGLQVLLEIHSESELPHALALEPELLGVNSRDLKTMRIDKESAIRLLQQLPPDIPLRVAESGIDCGQDVADFLRAGANAFLVGSYLMRSANLQQSFFQLYQGLKRDDA